MPIIRQIKGDLIDIAKSKKYNVTAIAHGCNCFCKMGAGVAKKIADAFPSADKVDKETIKGYVDKLGNYTFAVQDNGVVVYNLYTQYRYGRGGRKVDYEALARCFESLNSVLSAQDVLAIPLIGCGLAGGDEDIVLTIIDKVSKYKVIVVRQ